MGYTKSCTGGGSVYTQGEFRSHDPLLTKTLGKKTPENIVVIPWGSKLHYWIVEAKRDHNNLNTALQEAQSYADRVNDVESSSARFATGIAGTPDKSFYVTTTYWDNHKWQQVAINNYETTGFLSLEQCEDILEANNHQLAEFDDDPDRFMKKANAINQTLHDNEVPVNDRATIISALLLALAKDGNLRIHATASPLMREINGLIYDLLKQHGKDDFANVIQLQLPATEKNHRKFRKAIIDTLQHLREMNIRSAINSGDDALGKFYETFLKYANGAKEMGIVLTPRHITRFAVDVLGIGPRDLVFDPACGTGGFLISAMEEIRKSATSNLEIFRNENLFGVEQRDDVYGLAIVNMIFRGDGKSNIYDGNCFDHEFWLRDGEIWCTMLGNQPPEGARKPFTRVLMNPPYKLRTNSETAFVDYGLQQASDGAMLFAVLPAVVIGGKKYKKWRCELLQRHTVRACIKLDKNLFYPVAEATYALILLAHRPHQNKDDVYMGVLFDDHHRPRLSKMLPTHAATDNVEHMTNELRRFLLRQPVSDDIPREQCVKTLDQDLDCDFSPERYLSSGDVTINAVNRLIDSETSAWRAQTLPQSRGTSLSHTATFTLDHFIARKMIPPIKKLKEYPPGYVPVVTSTYLNNGVKEWLDVPKDLCFNHCITISTTHNTHPCEAFWHPYRFSAVDGLALVIKPIPDLLANPLAILYLCEAITAHNAWRYNYARPVRLHDLEVNVPVTDDGQPDIIAMAEIVQKQIS